MNGWLKMADQDEVFFDKELFIEEIRLHPYLYSEADKRYRNAVFKDNIWSVIGSQFGFTKDEARRKWKSLRDRYQRERKTYLEHKRSGGKCWSSPKWKFFCAISSFLEPAHQEKVNCAKLKVMSDDRVSTDKEDVSDGISEIPVESAITIGDCLMSVSNGFVVKNEPNYESGSDLQSASFNGVGDRNEDVIEETSPKNGFKRRRVEEVDVRMASLLATASESINRLAAEKRLELDQSHDDTFYYFSYLMARFRKLTPSQQRFVRKGFDKTMFEVDDLQS